MKISHRLLSAALAGACWLSSVFWPPLAIWSPSALAPQSVLSAPSVLWLSPLDTESGTSANTPADAPADAPLDISAPFSLPNGPYLAGHRGIDLPASPGDEVRSPTAGTVTFVGTVVDRAVISIRVDAHTVLSLEPVDSELRLGDRLDRGQPLGVVAGRGGAAHLDGHCSGACLHLGVRVDDVYVNPLRYLRSRPVLLPW